MNPSARRSLLLLVPILAAAVLLSGCIRGSGTVVTEERSVSGFSRIEVNGSGKLIVKQGSSEAVTVRADDNLMRYITTTVSGDTLVIQTGRASLPAAIWPSETIVYTVTVKDLTGVALSGSTEAEIGKLDSRDLEIDVSGSGSIKVDELQARSLSYTLSGSGSADVSGSVDEQTVGISGSGSYDAPDLESKRADVRISGSGSADLWVTQRLDVKMSGSGSVSYYGSPRVNQDISGSGSVDGLGEK